MEDVPLPTRADGVSVQIIIADGGGRQYAELLRGVYAVPLTPFLLGVPPENVLLFLTEGLINFPNDALLGVKTSLMVCFEGQVEFFPRGYHDYFFAVYQNAQTIDAPFELPPPHIRIFSGHSIGNFEGGHFIAGRETIKYSRFQGIVASLLTVFDTCNAAHAVASMTGEFPKNPKSFNSSKKRRVLKQTPIPLVCEDNAVMYAFSLGYPGQHLNPQANGGLKNMTWSFGDSALCSLLLASKAYVENNMAGSMDEFYKEAYESVDLSLLDVPGYTPKAISKLHHIQDLISSGALVVDVDSMNTCELFIRREEWFLTTARINALSPGQDEVAQQLISYVIGTVAGWHKANPDSIATLPESTKAFGEMIEALGPFGSSLRMVCLDWNEEKGTLVESPEGVEFESWAVSCGVLLNCLYKIKHVIRTGEFDESDVSD
jgi:hypothetical protein